MQDRTEPNLPPGSLFFTVFPSVMLPMFLAVVDQTIVSTALPAIVADLGGVERVSWVVVSYLIAGTIAAPVYGQLRDVYGGKRVMIVALGVFLAGSVMCAASVSVEMLALARVLHGLGGGGLMTLSQALIGASERGKQVTAVVEIKARFDEEHNIEWAKRLAESGVHVVYGLVGLKTHSKVALVVRREEHGLQTYTHISTGN